MENKTAKCESVLIKTQIGLFEIGCEREETLLFFTLKQSFKENFCFYKNKVYINFPKK